ncbi:hypothetical protein Ais01nite_75130 [Asanoa ishikariensis]|uniref:Uncharacterized protein n=1 Tax=Asanoa ishikariensis TaxID=137265 RepID=A0A1H3L620_9ACTN|nr:hypothetical protein Ais01nite_75130 [Asanoa ishikariensis]SDY59780.1 hypothetical protein SAMN05421684_0556 [Asanoa ishikariensis]
MTPSTSVPADVDVVQMSAAEWRAAAERGLQRLGITYDELAGQARAGDFTSRDAHKLWVAIGGRRP